MIDQQSVERAAERFRLPEGSFERLTLRRDRQRRDQRIRAGVLGIAIAIGVGWLGVIAIRSTPPVPADPPELPNTPQSWSRVQLDAPPPGDGPSILVAGPDRLAAVGVVYDGPATAWTSPDGVNWTRSASEDLDRTDIYDIRSGGPGFIATGSDGPTAGTGEPAIWTSEDGVSWNRLPDDPVFGDTLFISAVAPGGPGLVAVGSWMGAWHSSDGMTWERASVPPVPPEVYPGDDGETPQVYLSDLADQGGRLVATGSAMLKDDPNGDNLVVVVWTSRDGRSWTDVPTPADVFPPGSSISDLTGGPDGFVAVGEIAVGEVSTPAIWSSADGRDWRLHRPGPDGLQLSSVAAGDGGYVAVGATMECDTDCASREAVVMTSADGETWVRVPSGREFRVAQPGDTENAPGAAMFEVVAWGSRFAALGEYDGEPTVWVTTPGRESSEDPSPSEDPIADLEPLWPQTSLEEVRQAQELADAGDPRYTWQVDPDRWYQPAQNHPNDTEIFARFLEEELGWEEFLWDEAFAHPDGLNPGDVVYIRCAPGQTNPLYPADPERRACAPTIDEFRYETVTINVAQLDREGPSGIWVVTGWETIEPFEQIAPPSDAEITTFMEAFFQARIDGESAEEFADFAEYDPFASERVDREIPLLYATSTGAPYERSEFELVDGPLWPSGRMRFEVRLFAENGETVVEQIFSLERDETGRLRLVYDLQPTGPAGPVPATTENGEAVPVEYGFLDGEVTYRAAYPFEPSLDAWDRGPDRTAIAGLRFHRRVLRLLLILADPRPIGPGCEEAPAPTDPEALARSLRSDPDLEATAPVAVTIGGTPALQIDVELAPGAISCAWQLPDLSATTPLLLKQTPIHEEQLVRLYLLDLPGGSARVLAIAILHADVEGALESAAPIVDSIEFHAR